MLSELHRILIEKKLSISTAESCTGGNLAKLLTSNSGSSAYYSGGVITYQTHQKIKILGVNPSTISKHTVVSKEVASEMSKGCQKLFKTDIAISTTGVSGPNKGEDGKEVGTIFYSIRIFNSEHSFYHFIPNLERNDFIEKISFLILDSLKNLLINSN